ncbi:MAG TPA: hypothetical protein PLL10_03970, partial [Elusimicrobiales bacterium]|nr:hypothetical protein [Elusimicrobiales bacterium]
MKKLRLLHVITRLDSGGSAVSTFLGSAYAGEKFEVALAIGGAGGQANFLELKRRFGDNGAQVFLVPHFKRELSFFSDIAAFFELLSLMQDYAPDIVHTHTSKAGVLGRCAAAVYGFFASSRPKIVHT